MNKKHFHYAAKVSDTQRKNKCSNTNHTKKPFFPLIQEKGLLYAIVNNYN
jgi:hypothetical protein